MSLGTVPEEIALSRQQEQLDSDGKEKEQAIKRMNRDIISKQRSLVELKQDISGYPSPRVINPPLGDLHGGWDVDSLAFSMVLEPGIHQTVRFPWFRSPRSQKLYVFHIIFTSPGRLRTRLESCLLYTSPSPRDMRRSRMPSSA